MLPKSYSLLSSRCKFQADGGVVCPMCYECGEFVIKPYFLLSEELKTHVVSQLKCCWKDYTDAYIEQNWSFGDMLYVAVDKVTDSVIGTVAIDRKNFHPFISTVYVTPDRRNKGFARHLLAFAEVFIFYVIKYDEVRLWCDEDLLDFYFAFGYAVEDMQGTKSILFKKLIEHSTFLI